MLDAVLKAAIAVTPVGNFVDPCLFLLTEIWRSAENIKFNRCRARRLAERTQFVVDALFDLYGKKHEADVCRLYFSLLEEISTYLNKLASQSTIKRLINNHSIEVNLDALSTSLLAQAQTLQLCLQFNQLEWRVEDREDQREDNIQIQNSLSLLLDNSHKILESLEIKHNQIMEAMEGIQKAIVFSVNLNSNAEKTMLEKVLNGLARVSNGIPILQPWTITSWEIEIDEAIAVGGYAEVCTGNWLGHTKVAVKRLLYRLDTEKAAKEFRQEVEIWHRLKHPHVLQLFGRSTIHDVIHGDLKAINILVDDSGRAKITDFGFAVVKVTSNGNGNQSNIGTGTLRWTAPECLKGEKPTFKSDVYAFAVTCYEVVSEGCVPFSHLNDSAFRELILSGVRPVMPTGCPDGLSRLVGLCWDDDFAQRPLFNSISTSLKLILKTRSTKPSMGSSAVLTVQTAEKLPERSSERLLSNILPPDSPTRGMAMSPPTSPISPTFSAAPRTKSSRTRVATYPSIPQRSSSITSPTRAFPPQSPIQSHMRSSSITAVNNYVGNASGNSGDSGYTSGSNENFNRNQPNVPREHANSFTGLNNDSFQRTPASRKQSFPLLSPSTSPSSVIPSFTSLSGWNLRPTTTLTNDPSYEMLKWQADRGDANAMNKLGEMLLSIQQYKDAVNWFFKAAGMKCTQAMLHLVNQIYIHVQIRGYCSNQLNFMVYLCRVNAIILDLE
ncbi:kinase-like domain-containing protein [Paraphysoderma sedebokerense]|nr:kinase-like domain-containing protein [Paraphysoderma sedebokerense]